MPGKGCACWAIRCATAPPPRAFHRWFRGIDEGDNPNAALDPEDAACIGRQHAPGKTGLIASISQ